VARINTKDFNLGLSARNHFSAGEILELTIIPCYGLLRVGKELVKFMKTFENELIDRIADILKDFVRLDKDMQEMHLINTAKAIAYGTILNKMNSDNQALDEIHAALDCKEWSPETLDEIAAIVAATGRPINEPDLELG
jgi:hypothetical protein